MYFTKGRKRAFDAYGETGDHIVVYCARLNTTMTDKEKLQYGNHQPSGQFPHRGVLPQGGEAILCLSAVGWQMGRTSDQWLLGE